MGFPIVNGMRTIELGPPGPLRQWLVKLVIDGKKKATAGLYESKYLAQNEPIEKVGELLSIVDDETVHLATVEVTRVERCEFGEVPWEFAKAEDEGDESIEQWREGHRKFWTSIGEKISDDTEVVLIWFTLVEVTRRWPEGIESNP
jgi:uncharacterized protein YhfF